MNYYVYILQSENDASFYIGQTNNVEKRLVRHNKGHENFTKKAIPWKLMGFKIFASRKEAMAEEKRIKNFKSRNLYRYYPYQKE